MEQRYCIYRLTNLVNGKTYIGLHHVRSSSFEDDAYFGSGIIIKMAVIKYGRGNFKREVIEDFLTREEAEQKEIDYISLERSLGHAEYNLHDGGIGGDMTKFIKDKDYSFITDEYRKKRSEEVKQRRWYTNGVECTMAHSCPEGWWHGRTHKGKKLTDETKEKIRQSRQKYYSNLDEDIKRGIAKKTQETKKRLGLKNDQNKGKHVYNNGEIMVFAYECPDGFVPGRLKSVTDKIVESRKIRNNTDGSD